MSTTKWTLGFILIFLCCTVPPFDAVVSRWVLRWWPPMRVTRAAGIVRGAHESIIVTVACKLGVFNKIHDLNNEQRPKHFLAIFARRSCVTLDAIAGALLLEPASISPVLNALVVLNMMDQDGQCYRNSPLGEGYFVAQTAEEENMCGMLAVNNNREILWRLASLHLDLANPTKQTHVTENRAMLKPMDQIPHDGSLFWEEFARSTAGFSAPIAKRVEKGVSSVLLKMHSTKSISVFDVGCGSGEYLRALIQSDAFELGSKFVYVDLPGVLRQTKVLHEETSVIWRHQTEFFEASIFDEQFFLRIAQEHQPVMIMMNSFLQHFDEEEVADILRKLLNSILLKSSSYLVITELVVDPNQSTLHFPHEIIPMTSTFDVVLKAITQGGTIRSAADYIRLANVAGWKVLCDMQSLFPMPAFVMTFSTT